MSDKWTEVTTRLDDAPRSKVVRLSDGGELIGKILGEPYAVEVVWTGSRLELPLVPEDRDVQLRVLINVYDIVSRRVVVLECPTRLFRRILAVRDKYGLDKWVYRIVRNSDDPSGEGARAVYSVLPHIQCDDLGVNPVLHNLEQVAQAEYGQPARVLTEAAVRDGAVDLGRELDAARAKEVADGHG